MTEPALPPAAEIDPIDPTGIERIVADPLRFKRQLQIGEDAYAILKTGKQLSNLNEIAGAAGTGAAIAGSATVASTFFAPTGLAAWLGLATAATPIGWVVAAAVVAGGGYYGVSRWFSGKTGNFVDTIPRYVSTPLDVLGAALVDLLGSLALRVAAMDGRIDPAERACIIAHFVEDWGIDATYVARVLNALTPRADDTQVKVLAKNLAQFQAANRDCNGPAMQAEMMRFLRELVAADGVIDEREKLALEAIERVLEEENRLTLAKVRDGLGEFSSNVGAVAGEAASAIGGKAKSLADTVSRKFHGMRDKSK